MKQIIELGDLAVFCANLHQGVSARARGEGQLEEDAKGKGRWRGRGDATRLLLR